MAGTRWRSRMRFATARSSMASRLWVLASWLETSWRKLPRTLAMRACSRASRLAALIRLRKPHLARDRARERRCSRPRRRASGFGACKRPISVPSEDLRARRDDRLAGQRVELLDWPKQPPQPPGVIVDAESPDTRQGNRAGMTLPDPDREGPAPGLLVAQPEAVAAASLVPASREADPVALALASLRVPVGGKGAAAIHGGLLEHLRADLVPPCKPSHLQGSRPLGVTRSTRPAASLFRALKALMRSKPDQGTATEGQPAWPQARQ
jgi:hypothetical protein